MNDDRRNPRGAFARNLPGLVRKTPEETRSFQNERETRPQMGAKA